MSFAVSAGAYDRFMGKYSAQLSPQLVDYAGLRAGQRAIDVGCGPGALTRVLIERLGPTQTCAVDPSGSFVQAARERFPGVDIRRAAAEHLPFPDASFDAALAQLVVHFMTDPVAGLGEMARVVRPGGVVATCVWDHAGERSPVSLFWRAARELDPAVPDESGRAGARDGHLAELLVGAGLRRVETTAISASVVEPTFDSWWEPFTLGVGPAGAYLAGLAGEQSARLQARCRELLGRPPIEVTAYAWTARGIVGGAADAARTG